MRSGTSWPRCATSSIGAPWSIPICVSRLDGKPHELSPKAMRFAEALLVLGRLVADLRTPRNRRLAPPERR